MFKRILLPLAIAALLMVGPGHTAMAACDHANKTEYVYEATCTQDGYRGYICSDCGAELPGQVIPTMGHDYSCMEYPASCTQDGARVYTCQKCGDVQSEEIEATGHDYSFVEYPASCTEPGTRVYTCQKCGDVQSEEIEATGHDYSCVEYPASCTESGTRVYTCQKCGDVQSEEIEAMGHDYSCVEIPASCTEPGTRVYTCQKCGDVQEELFVTMAHKPYSVPPKAATCTEDGYGELIACEICGVALTPYEVYTATGHRPASGYNDGIHFEACKDCGELLRWGKHERVVTVKGGRIQVACRWCDYKKVINIFGK